MSEKIKNYLMIGSGILLISFFAGTALVLKRIPQAAQVELKGEPLKLSAEELEGIGKVNINAASQSDLEALPQIGPVTAKAIIDYRTARAFVKIEDIMNVRGIGRKTFEKIKKYLVI